MSTKAIQLDFLDIGKGEKTLLFLHGLGSTKHDWDDQIPFFSNEYRVITPDLRGHGKSVKPSIYGVEYMVEDIKKLLDSLRIEKVTPIGFSMGGAVAFQLAYSYPDYVDKLIIVNSSPDFNNMGQIGEDLLTDRTAYLKTKSLALLAKEIAFNMFPEDHQRTMRDTFEERCAANDLDAYYNAFVTLMHWGLGKKLTAISAKTLVIASDMDYTPVDFKEEYANRMQDAIVHVIKNSRHGVVIDQAKTFNRTVYNFLKNNE